MASGQKPVFAAGFMQVTIPKLTREDELVRCSSNSGQLSLKDAYYMLQDHHSSTVWGSKLWSKAVPPSKSFLLWRLIHDKIPKDDKLWQRGCHVVSMCSLCNSSYETSDHLFFHCIFAKR